MKAFLIFLLIGCSYIAKGQSTEIIIPSSVSKAFNKSYNQVQGVRWERNGKTNYEVEFEMNELDYYIVYDSKGNIIKEKREIEYSQLPNQVKNTLANLFKEREVHKVELLEKEEEVFYIIEFEDSLIEDLVVLSKNGKVVDTLKSW